MGGGGNKIFTLHTCGVEYCAGCKWIMGPSSLWSEEKHLTYMHLIRKWSPGWQAGGRNQLVQLGDCCQLKSPEIALKPPRVSEKHTPRWHRVRFLRSRVRQPVIGPPRPPGRRWESDPARVTCPVAPLPGKKCRTAPRRETDPAVQPACSCPPRSDAGARFGNSG